MRHNWLIFLLFVPLLLCFGKAGKVSAEEMIKVRLVNDIGETNHLQIKLKGDYLTLDPTLTVKENVNYRVNVKKRSLIIEGNDEQQKLIGSLFLIPERYDEKHIIFINNKPYLGAIEIKIENNEYIRPINQLPVEDYLKGVVPFEVFPTWGLETLKAQALAARTYAYAHINEEIDDTILFQVYGGFSWDQNTTKAVEDTNGEVITFQNHLIDAFYSASNGGITENNAHVWGGNAMPYFPIKKDPYDPTHPWKFTLHKTQVDLNEIDWDNPNWWQEAVEKDEEIALSMKNWLQKNGYPGEIKILSIPRLELSKQHFISNRSNYGSIKVEFLHKLLDGTILYEQLTLDDVKLNKIRPMIGGNHFKSYYIDSFENDGDIYTMKGKGFGHGVGMSQWGANSMGEIGKTYQEILQFYYPGTTITTHSN